jgi:hypothetical protein
MSSTIAFATASASCGGISICATAQTTPKKASNCILLRARNDLQLVGGRRGERGVELHNGCTLGIEIHLRHILGK